MKLIFTAFFACFTSVFYSQQTETVDFERIYALLDFDYPNGTVTGELEVKFKMLDDADFVYLNAKNITKYSSTLNGKLISTHTDDGRMIFTKNFLKGETYSLLLKYTAKPDKALYFVNNGGFQQIWTQGQGKYTSNWLPSIDDMNDKIEFDLSIIAYPGQEVVSNGVLIEKEEKGEKFIWHFEMTEPMSSYLVAVVMGDYRKIKYVSDSGIPMELYYYPTDSMKVLSTYKYSKEIFNYLEEEIGVKFPWPVYRQVPVKDFLYAGMENTMATIFSDQFVVDRNGFIDRNYVSVNAHELAHQWFGDYVTATSGTHHWLQEGFATYYALLAERKVFGEDYYYWQLYKSAEELKALSDKGKGERLLDPKASSLTFYQKGAWALHILREEIGDEAFRTGIKSYLNNFKYKNASTEDFLKEMRKSSGMDLIEFEKNWLQQTAFQDKAALEVLKKSPIIQKYMRVVALRNVPFSQKQNKLLDLLALPDEYTGQEAVYQLADVSPAAASRIYERAFYTNNPWVRQAIARTVQKVPLEMKTNYERLLNDDSYITREQALLNLWSSFPSDRHKYLNQMKGVQGFSDHNIEITWLALAISTLDYEEAFIRDHFFRLTRFTGNRNSYATRQNAFEKLYQLQLFEPKSLENLVDGCFHINWRFSESCKNILNMLLKDPEWKKELKKLDLKDEKQRKFLAEKLV